MIEDHEIETPDGDEIDLFRGLTPRPTQKAFIESNARQKAYIGNVGSGKTEALVWHDILLNHLFAPNYTLVGRFRYPDLRDTTRKRYLEIANPKLILEASIPEKGDGYVLWRNGSQTIFRNLDEPSKFGSLELGAASIDEGYECPEMVWNMLTARVGRHFTGARRGTYAPLVTTTNPGGKNYLYKLFCTTKAIEAAKRARAAGLAPDYELFHPKPKENEEALPPDYYKKLAAGKPDWWIRRFINGELGALEGLVWPRFEEAIHVIAPLPSIPRHWPRRTGHDHGSRNPTAVLWCASDEEGNIIIYREYEKAGLVPSEHCRNILRIEKEEPKITNRPADPSMFNKTVPTPESSDWHSIAEEYEQFGVPLDRADNAMLPSLVRVDQLLWQDPDHRWPSWHPRAGNPGSPRLFIYSTCETLIERVSSWKFKEYAAESLGLREEPEEKDDHLPDCLRYIATSFPDVAPRIVTAKRAAMTHQERQRSRVISMVKHYRRLAYERDNADLLDAGGDE